MIIVVIVVVVVVVAGLAIAVSRRRSMSDGVDSFRRQIDALSPEARRPVVDQVQNVAGVTDDDQDGDEDSDGSDQDDDDGA